MNTIHLEPNMIPPALRGAYDGKKFQAQVTATVTIPSDAGLWSEGSRDTYQLIDLATGEAVKASDNLTAPWDGARKDREITLQPGYAVIRHTIARGKDMGLTFFVHPDNAAKLLPAPPAPLTPYELTVLEATCGKKSSYGGKDRYQMAQDDCRPFGDSPSSYLKSYGLDAATPFPSRAQWDEAKALLIGKGLLNKAGAVTPAGRNARTR